jgi:dihydrolipoamide dehydrogenase
MKLVILGGGPGGYAAAIRGAQLGARVTVVEENRVGGVCLNIGCIPTKTLLRAARWLHEQEKMKDYGITGELKLDLEGLMRRKDKVVELLTSNVAKLLQAYDVELISGRGVIAQNREIQVSTPEGKRTLSWDRLILATGSRPIIPPVPGLDNPGVMDSTGALTFSEVPSRLTILGGGVIALEFALLYQALGSQVTLMEMLPTILPREDELVQEAMTAVMEMRGITVMTGTTLTGVEAAGNTLKLIPDHGEAIETDKLLVAVGRRPNVEAIGLEHIGLTPVKGAIAVNDYLETEIPGVYAVGDCTAKMMLAHTAAHQGLLAAENAMGGAMKIDYRSIPGGLYTFPEAASVGLTEAEVREQYGDARVGLFPYEALGKGLADHETDGFIKIVAEPRHNEIMGVHIVGDRATDLIAEGALAIGLEACLEDIAHQVHGHPTFNEGMGESAMAALGMPLHLFPEK